MKVSGLVDRVGRLFQSRKRRGWVGARRAYVEFRDLQSDELPAFVSAIERGAVGLRFLEWVQVNAALQRVVFSYADNAYGFDDLADVVAAAERAVRASNALFGSNFDVLDDETLLQRQVELISDLLSFVVGLSLTLSPLPKVPLSGNLVALLSLVRSSPRLRAGIETRLGVDRAKLAMSLGSSLLQGLAQRPLSALVDASHKALTLRELREMRAAWLTRESDFFDGTQPPRLCAAAAGARALPLPAGPIEEYADRAWVVSFSGFLLSFITTRSIQRATAALFGGLPHPARMSRDVFSAQIGVILSQRRMLVRDPEVLRRFDRIDCLVIPRALVDREQFVISGVLADEAEEAEASRERARRMFDVDRPLAVQSDGLWSLRPWVGSNATSDVLIKLHAEQRSKAGALLLSLERAGRIVALVEVDIIPRTGVEELIAAAHEAHLRVVIAEADETVFDRFTADDVISVAEGVRAGMRRLQREGYGIAMVAHAGAEGLANADLAIGLHGPGSPVPWEASLICGTDLADVAFVIRACRVAKRVSKQAVNIALGAASVGALVSAGGLLPLTTQRVIFVVNIASLASMLNGHRAAVKLSRRELPPPRDPTPWHALDAEGVLARLNTSRAGLVRTEVSRRQRINVVPIPQWERLVEAVSDELFSPLAPLLAAGAGLSAVVGSTADASMVASVVVVNAVIGGVQRFRTERKIQNLARTEERTARVRRGGLELNLGAAELVRGDIVLLRAGDVVPADCRILSATSVEVDASSLTGESLPVAKHAASSLEAQVADRASMLFEGTSIACGHAEAVVVASGNATEARRGAANARPARRGGVEQRLRALMDLTGPVALSAGIGVVGGGLLRGRKLSELVGSGVSLAVASVPEGLPLLATAAQLAAAQRLAERGALVRNGRSIEALGRVDTVCLDKTGTVTEGRVLLFMVCDSQQRELASGITRARRHILATALRASRIDSGDEVLEPTDAALKAAADGNIIAQEYGCTGWKRRSEISYESGRGYHATLGVRRDVSGRLFQVMSVKGAPEVVLPMCGVAAWFDEAEGDTHRRLDEALRAEIERTVSEFADAGLRVLGVAERVIDVGQGDHDFDFQPASLSRLVWRGLIVFSDPVRPSARQAIRGLNEAGVRTIMITGDHPSTARAIAEELELPGSRKVLTGAELSDLDDTELDARINHVGVFARITPAQKVRVVRALQRSGAVVAMAGDGANDAPAIRLADVGIAVGANCTAAARAAADIVLTDGSIETLVHAIAEGRAMWASVREAVSILLGGNFGEIAFTAAVGLLSGRPPLSARQLLLVNLLTDVAPAMAIALRAPSEDTLANVTQEGPEKSLGQPLNREIVERAALTAAGASAAWTTTRALLGSHERAATVALAALVGTQLGQTLRAGYRSKTVLATGIGSAAILAAVIQTPGVSQFFGCRPLGPISWLTVAATSLGAANFPTFWQMLKEYVESREKAATHVTQVHTAYRPERSLNPPANVVS